MVTSIVTRYSWSVEDETKFAIDWAKSDYIDDMVDKYWEHPGVEDIEGEQDDEKTRTRVAQRLQSRATSLRKRNHPLQTIGVKNRKTSANELGEDLNDQILSILAKKAK